MSGPSAERIPPTVEQDWYFTFGIGDKENAGTFVVIHGTSQSARAEMLRRFGRKWGFQYDAVDWIVGGVSQAEKYGLVQQPCEQPGKEKLVRRLRAISNELASIEVNASALRSERDRLALELVQVHELTWRETAEFAGFANPYIAKILRDQRAENSQEQAGS